MPEYNYSKAKDQIKDQVDIADVIGSVLTLKSSGSSLKACCPFHKEKTPSFMVNRNRQSYHCFGCGETGDVISFVQKYYNLTFTEAIERLAAQYGIVLEERSGGYVSKDRDDLLEANRLAARFFFRTIAAGRNPGLSYMLSRGLDEETIKKFGIGYADAEWTSLTDALIKAGVKPEHLLTLGLSSKSEKNGKLYDRFRNRVIFPIFDVRGKVIGFGGRTIESIEPKYLNSQESEVFLKKNNLYALNFSRTEIQKEGCAILVEGYMDAVSLYRSGVRNVAASLGTALTPEQARLLKRYAPKVVLCYDSDAAGIKAALRGIDVLREAGLEVRVLNVDDGKDPDEYVKKHGRDAFLDLVDKKSVTDVDYKFSLARKKYDLSDVSQSVKFLKAVATIISGLSPVEQDVYIKQAAREYRISEGALRAEVGGKTAGQEPRRRSGEEPSAKERPRISRAELNTEMLLIRLSLLKSEYFSKLKDYPGAVKSPEGIDIFSVLSTEYAEGTDFDLGRIREALGDGDLAYLDRVMNDIRIGDKDDEIFEDCVEKLKDIEREERIRVIMDIIKTSDEEKDAEDLEKLMAELNTLRKEKRR